MPDPSKLERFESVTEGMVTHETNELTALCPFGGVQDHYEIEVKYIPADWCVELKSLKLYFESWRGDEATHEEVAEKIFNHLTELLEPEWLIVICRPQVRGGIRTQVVKET